jgi:hypothetical protein
MERQGVVRVREEMQVELPWHRYTARWQPSPDAPEETFRSEDGPGWNEIEDAIKWARSHAPIVYVRLGQGLSEIYNAGESDGDAQRPAERWPGALPARARNVHPDYGGVVYVDEEHLVFVPTGRFSAVWGSATGEFLEDAEDLFEDVEVAIDWGRARAPVVLVAELPLSWRHVPTYEIRSAGDADPPGDPLERLRPRPGHATMEWSFTTQETVIETEPDAFSRELEDALHKDSTVSDPVCRVLQEQSGFGSLAIVPTEAALVTLMEDPHAIRGWVDVSFRVSAPTRKRAFELAFAALHRARDSGEETVWNLMGNFTLHASS